MEAIQLIGAYAGLAAVVGLGVLSALYFSQARDLRRLREWAARAGERPPAPRATAQPRGSGQGADAAPVAPAAGADGEKASDRATGAQPQAVPAARQPASALSGAPASQAAGGAPANVPSGPPAPAGWQGPQASPARTAPARPVSTSPSAGAPARPTAGRPSAVASPARPPERSMSLRFLALAAVGALIVIGAGTFAVGLIGGREEPAAEQGAGTAGEPSEQSSEGAGDPSSVTFSVLNGTGVDGLAKQVADELEAAGYRRGNVTNASSQRAESAILYAQGAREEAQAVARELDVGQIEPIDSASQSLAGDASVVVLVGADQTQ
jgi:hypothetical protein